MAVRWLQRFNCEASVGARLHRTLLAVPESCGHQVLHDGYHRDLYGRRSMLTQRLHRLRTRESSLSLMCSLVLITLLGGEPSKPLRVLALALALALAQYCPLLPAAGRSWTLKHWHMLCHV